MDITAKIATRIIELCKENNITINKLADLSGLTQSTLDSIVNGKSRNPQIITIYKICNGLHISLAEFFSDNEGIATYGTKNDDSDLPRPLQQEIDLIRDYVIHKYHIKNPK
jgi:transcriptional regulator with XRE-family HTH domain